MAQVTRYNFHSTEILKEIKKVLEEKTGLDVFVGDRPTNNKEQRSEMLVISLPYSIRQKDVYQSTYLRIEIIVKDKTEGRVNVSRLEELSNILISLFPIKSEGGRWKTMNIPALVLQGKDTIGFSIWYMQCSLQINKTDTYSI